MTVFAHIVDGALDSIGELPPTAIRQDTGQRVDDVGRWLRACGYYDLNTVDPDNLDVWPDLTDEQRAELRAAIADAKDKQQHRHQLSTKVHALIDVARDRNWDWLDRYCDGSVAQIPFVREQSPNAGADWGPLATLQKAEALRLGVSLALMEHIRIAQAVALYFDALSDLITAADVDTVPDR